jgi:hypothetical protein
MTIEEIQERFQHSNLAKSCGLLTETCTEIKKIGDNLYAVIIHEYMTGTYQILKVNIQTLEIDFVYNNKGTTLFDRVDASTTFREMY